MTGGGELGHPDRSGGVRGAVGGEGGGRGRQKEGGSFSQLYPTEEVRG